MKASFWLAASLCACAAAAGAGDFDGSHLLICAPVEAKSCVAAESCANSTPGEIGAPAFLRIDFAKQQVVGPRTATPIKVQEKDDKQIVLMGTEQGFGWTIVLDQESGEISSTLTNRDSTVVLFGSCTPL
jgi:hypothetical protein